MQLIDADKHKEELIRRVMADIVTPIVVGQQTVDAVERKRGEWIDLGKDRVIRWQCSECGRKDTHIYSFCPNCGADMRSENNG